MKKKWLWIVLGVILAINAGSLGTLAWLRLRDAREFAVPCEVHTYGGTNYTVQLLEAAVGRVDTGCVVIVYARLANPNPFPVTLKREWFVLMDHEKEYYEPTQLGVIQLPASGVVEKEEFSFMVTDAALDGLIALKIGQQYFVTVKSPTPFRRQLSQGKFYSFRQRDW